MKMVLFIHIGKAAGPSGVELKSAFHSLKEIDMHPVIQKNVDEARQLWISGRDPIDRLISAYNWRHPRNCNQNNMCKDVTDTIEIQFYQCFPSLSDFVKGTNVQICFTELSKV